MPGKAKARTRTIHGVLLSIFGRGVLIVGGSGSGKTVAALELMDRGHRLVADDAVCLYERNGGLFGSAPDDLRGLVYVPGMGSIDARRVFGDGALLDESLIELCLELAPRGTIDEALNDESQGKTVEFLGVSVPLVLVEAGGPRISPVLAECAVKARFGHDTSGNTASADVNDAKTFHM
ncbi:MAG: hypothetical protein AB7Q37_14490 [Pyrinomonadaceae bacterium]